MNKSTKENHQNDDQDYVVKFFSDLFRIDESDFIDMSEGSDRPLPKTRPDVHRMPGVMKLKNQPEFAADAPWRLEPDQEVLPLVFYIRDADRQSSAKGPWQLDLLKVEQKNAYGDWDHVISFLPENLPGVNENGQFERNFWSYEVGVPLTDLQDAQPGGTIQLQILFIGSFPTHEESSSVERYLEIHCAQYSLPLSRTAHQTGPRNWFYGDTHYHSSYTNDLKEYGGVISATRAAGHSIGLDWLVVTDHSVDLGETDSWDPEKTRWERLKKELASPGVSDEHFRFILGEEITVFGKDNRIGHMLAIGGLEDMIPGAFLPDDGGDLKVNLCRAAIEGIIKYGEGYPENLSKQLFGKLHQLNEVLDLLPEGTLAFAAHPYSVAQIPPAKWAEEDLSHPRLTGHEFWNGRSRKKASSTDNPFSHSDWTDPDKLSQNDHKRIEKIQEWVNENWDQFLKSGVDDWRPDSNSPLLRPVFIAGSDAHGDFNYHAGMAWDYSSIDLVDDNALGKVRTVLHLPDYLSTHVPEEGTILEALNKGACVVTDGPILEMSVKSNNQIAHMGDVLQVSNDGDITMNIKAHSTPEFGHVQLVEVVNYFKGQKEKDPKITQIEIGATEAILIDGNQGYCRVQGRSIGSNGEQFCCFTNPIWIRATDSRKMRIQASFFS